MERDLSSETKNGKKVTLFGFVDTRRDHGRIIFFDLRDASGVVQIVSTPKKDKAYHIASRLSSEDVVSVSGTVNLRPKGNINPDLPTGKVEVQAENITLISKAEAPAIPVNGDGYKIEEVARFKYRYLDLRRPRMQKNLKFRAKTSKLVREYLDNQDFIEIETPYLSKTTPEGARDFLVPSRLQSGKFYALAQSPQQYKQLLMLSGFERYYQLARAFRDEDLRSDRQFEHTQIDIEMAFVDREDVMRLVEGMIIEVSKKLGKKIAKKPFPIVSYEESVKKYGNDRPNLSKSKDELSFVWVVDFPLFEKKDGGFTFSHNPFTAPYSEDLEKIKGKKDLENIKSLQMDLVCNGEEVGSGSIRITDPEIQSAVFGLMGYSKQEIKEQFGHLLNAYKYGAPIHGGIALGFDRLVSLLIGENNIREVIAFPVTSGGQTSVMDAPSEIKQEQLKEFGIKLDSNLEISGKKDQEPEGKQ